MRKLTPAQIRKIKALMRALAMTDGEYRAALEGVAGVESAKDLTIIAAGKVIDYLEGKAVTAGVWQRPKTRWNHLSGRELHMATPKQLRMVEAMWRQVTRAKGEDNIQRAFAAFIKRIVKVSNPRFLEKHHIERLVKALEGMGAEKEG